MWLPNSRGSRNARNHVTKNPDDPASGFWNFTWHEMGIFDHPPVIDFILSKTKFDQLNYIGHHQGSTSLFVLLSSKPEYNSKINIASLMSPIAFVEHAGYKVKSFFEPFLSLRVRSINDIDVFDFPNKKAFYSREHCPPNLEPQTLSSKNCLFLLVLMDVI